MGLGDVLVLLVPAILAGIGAVGRAHDGMPVLP
jgi:hypothetical protein